MIKVLFWSMLYAFSTATSITILGDRNLISGDMTKWISWLGLIFNWKFILAMTFAVIARLTFTMMNSTILSVPYLAKNATSVATMLTALSYIVTIIANAIFLHERLTWSQFFGMMVILLGVSLIIKK